MLNKNSLISATMIFLVSWVIIGCSTESIDERIDNPQPSVYFWRTTYHLSAAERNFMRSHQVKKMYLRLFDVVDDGDSIMPNATITFNERPDTTLDIIPVVFITEDCLRHSLYKMAPKIVDRILKICDANGIRQPREIQIDCDYTSRSRKHYFEFLDSLRHCFTHTPVKCLSVTIRLHQLSMPVPESADYGVLMMYNTGDVNDYRCSNPILSLDDVKPFLPHLTSYRLPLCAAFPCFGWKLLYHGTEFKAILHEDNLEDSTIYQRISRDKYVVVSSRDIPTFVGNSYSIHLSAGDSIFQRQCTIHEIMEVKDALIRLRTGIDRQIILYDLNEENINRYKYNEYEEIFHH